MSGSVFVAIPGIIYAQVDSREEFDKINRPMTDHSKREGGNKVLSKTVEQDGVTVVFQHWLKDSGGGA